MPAERVSGPFQAVLRQRCEQARLGLVADLDALDERYATGAAAAAEHDIQLLCAVKASTHPEVLRRAGDFGLGFDIANARELAHARAASPGAAVSLTTPALPMGERGELYLAFAGGEIQRWHCDSLGQLEELARACPGSTVGVRVNLDGLDIPAGMPLWRPSRFGIRLGQLPAARDIAAAHGCALRWLHMHNGSEENDTASYVFAAGQIVAAAREHGIDLAALDLGGGVLVPPRAGELSAFFGAIREAAGPDVQLTLEPGRFWLADCISLVTQVLDVKETADHVLLVLDFGLMSHLQWSDGLRIPVLGPVAPDDQRPWRICGRSCFEEDWLEEWEEVPVVADGPIPRVGDSFVLGNVTGYSIELSCCFNGIDRQELEAVRP
jgi:diaminopimelate decarboxylase